MIIREIIDIIERFAPLALQEKWDNSGVQIGSTLGEVSGVVVALDVTPRVVDRAIAAGANLIISHHPLFFDGVKQIDPSDIRGDIIYRSVLHNITIYSSHTPSDSTRGGINDYLAEMLGLQSVMPLEISALDSACGMGRVGDLPSAISASELCSILKKRLGVACVPHSADFAPTATIKKITLCGGSGSSLIDAAIATGADAYVSADLKYNNFQQTQGAIALFDVGHYASEICFVDIICALLEDNVSTNQKKIHTFAIQKVNENFISYYTS